MLFELQQFEPPFRMPAGWSDRIYRYCDFHNIDTQGGDVDSVFIGCKITDCTWYWGLFNLAIFVQVDFRNCAFRGTAFSGAKFVECNFTACEFVKDNLGADCSFDDVAWHGCTQNDCPGLELQFRSKH